MPRLDHPVGQGCTGDIHTNTLQDRFLPVQWQGILVFGNANMCQQPRGSHALGDGLCWKIRSLDAVTTTTGILLTDMLDYLDLGRNDIQLLRGRFTDLAQCGTIMGAKTFPLG